MQHPLHHGTIKKIQGKRHHSLFTTSRNGDYPVGPSPAMEKSNNAPSITPLVLQGEVIFCSSKIQKKLQQKYCRIVKKEPKQPYTAA